MITVSENGIKIGGTPKELLADLTCAMYEVQKSFDKHNIKLNVFDTVKEAYDYELSKEDSSDEKLEDMFKELGSLIKELRDLQKLNKEGK